jgi:hypothetical protein
MYLAFAAMLGIVASHTCTVCSLLIVFTFCYCFLFRWFSPPLPAGQRNRNAAAFSALKKYAPHFFNGASGATAEKEAANPVTGFNSKHNLLVHIVPVTVLYIFPHYEES